MAKDSFLNYLINHVVLPPKLPQRDDSDVEKEREMVKHCLSALKSFLKLLPEEERLPWISSIKMVSKVLEMRESNGNFSATAFDTSLENLRDGDMLALHIRGQNAGLIIRILSDQCCFESFEVLPTNSAVMQNAGRLHRRFPGPAVAIDRHRIADRNFRMQFAQLLAWLDSQTLEQACPVVEKAGSKVGEIRDTVHPLFVTEMVTGMMRAMGQPLEIVRMQKNTRDEVLWKDSLTPWRRSPVWLFLRVIMQRNLMLQYEPAESRAWYKSFMIFFMSTILKSAVQEALPSDIVLALIAKISRRTLKLQKMEESPWLRLVNHTLSRAYRNLSSWWKSFEQSRPVLRERVEWQTLRSSFILDSNLSLSSLKPFITKIRHRVSLPPTGKSFDRDSCLRIDQSHHVLPSLSSANNTAYGGIHLALADFEKWVCDCLSGWLNENLKHNNAAVNLGRQLEHYWKLAKDNYANSPRDFSLMVLTTMELWVALDKCTLQYCPLLRDYDLGFPSSLFDPLLLPWKPMMARLVLVEQYLDQRKRKARAGCPSIFESIDTSQSFPVRYFDSSPEHQARMRIIELEAQSERTRKKSELATKKQRYHQLLEDSHLLSCHYVDWRVRGQVVARHDPGCRKCNLESQARKLSIEAHEWPLPENGLEAKAAVFELDVPAPIRQWRDTTYGILVEVLSPRYDVDKSHRRKSDRQHAYLVHEYVGLQKFVVSRPGRLQLASSAKPFVISHYRSQKISVASEESICVNNGLRYAPYDSTTGHAPRDLLNRCTIRVPCTIKLPAGPYQLLQYAVDDTVHTTNKVIAEQAQCPEGLTVHEYLAFANLRSGSRLQWRNIGRELVARTLNFEREEVYVLIAQTIWQAGPGRGIETCRDSHQDLEEDSFGNSLLSVLEESLSNVEENWRGVTCLRTLVIIASRVMTFSVSQCLQRRCCTFLKRARRATLNWTRELRDKLQHAESEAESQQWNERVLEVALTCYTTFDVDPSQLLKVIGSDDDLATLTESAIIVHDRCPALESSLPNSIQMLLHRARRLAHYLEPILRERISVSPAGLDLTIHRIWIGYSTDTRWKALSQPNERWLVTETSPRDGELSVTIHLNLLTGSLLVSGMPLTRLPRVYESHTLYQRLFGQKILDVVPSNMEGMVYSARGEISGSQVHFGFYGSELLVRSRRGDKLYELLPTYAVQGDFPESFVGDYVHWLDVGSCHLEWRPLDAPWTPSPLNWHINNSSSSPCSLTRGSITLLDVRSSTVKDISATLAPLEYPQHIHVMFNHVDDSLQIHLPRLRLDFFLDKSSQSLYSKQYRGMYVDPSQSLGTLTGLFNKLVLQHCDNSERCVLIPYGEVQYQPHDRHVQVSIDTKSFQDVAHHFYIVDTQLGRLKDDGSLKSQLFKYFLHAVTAHCLPDELTGRTGTEEALHGLRTAATRSFLSLDPAEVALLKAIANLTPRRRYYPQHLRVMQEIRWETLSPLSQHYSFREAVRLIFHQSAKFDLFQLKPAVLPDVDKDSDPDLTQRASIRDSTFYVEDFGAERHTVDCDTVYHGRDDIQPDSLEHQIYLMAKLTDEWSTNLAGCRSLMSEIESWQKTIKGPSTEDHILFGYEPKLLEELNVWLPEEWCSLQIRLSTSSPEQDKYGIMIFLSILIFLGRASPELARSLLAFATVAKLRLLRPPTYPFFELAHEFKPNRGRVLSLVEQNVKPDYYCPEASLSPLPGETYRSREARLREAWELAQQERVETLVNAFMGQWPRQTAYRPITTDCDSYISTDDATSDVSKWFESWHRNDAFKTYIAQAQQVLDSLVLVQSPSNPYSIPYFWQANVPQSTYIRFQDICQRAASTSFSELTFAWGTVLGENEGRDGIQKDLPSLLRRISLQASTTFEKQYVEDLSISFESLKMETSFRLSESPAILSEALKAYLQKCKEHTHNLYRALCQNLQTGMSSTHLTICEVGMSPRTPPAFFLSFLARHKFATLSAEWRKCILSYGLSFCAVQRAQRLVRVIHNEPELIEELRNGGHSNWDPASETDWLLFEIENDLLIRPVQARIATEMIKPSSGKNSVMQLGMGEGKSSVIVPIVAATLANGKELARVLVLKPLATQMFHLLVQKLGGMLDRPIFFMPFSRSLRLDADRAKQICNLYEECARTRGVLLLQPEHLLSFELMGPERLFEGQYELGWSLIRTQHWLNQHARDILDESDEILSVRFELVYTVGSQQTIELSPDRWIIIQHVLGIVDRCAGQFLDQHPQSLEVRPSQPGRFALVRILQPAYGVALLHLVARDVCNNGVPGVPTWTFSRHMRDSLFDFLTQADRAVDSISFLDSGKESMENSLLLLRALFAGGILTFAFHRKRWCVNYGLDLSRSMLAVPYHAKDMPAARAEFSHPDVTIVLTCLSYYHGGLSNEQLYTAFNMLLLSDQAEEEYQRWIHDAPQMPSAFRQLRGVNLKNALQCEGQIFPPLRFSKGAIDFHLSNAVFPREMKEFPSKMSASGWNIARNKARFTTGFSGTNDSRYILPLSIEQSDLPQQRYTNASVLNCLLKPDNTFQSSRQNGTQRILNAETLLSRVVTSTPPIRVILDVGAQVLEMQNQDFASYWLSKLSDVQVQAAIYFDDDNELYVVNRANIKERLMVSSFAKQMDQCLVYLDESHTRGTDLKLPLHYRAAVTLGPDLTKDRLVQACLRMRKLDRGQSVMFLGPADVEQQILQLNFKSQDEMIEVPDILAWSIANTYSYTKRCVGLWSIQGMRYQRHHVAWSEPISNGNEEVLTKFANSLLEPEAQTIKQRYGPAARKLNSHIIQGAREEINDQRGDEFDAIQNKCDEFGVTSFDSATLQEEQERELSPENEQERQIQRPPPSQPRLHHLHPDVVVLIRQGILRRSSDVFQPAFRTLLLTSAASLLQAYAWPGHLLATEDFMQTVEGSGHRLLDFYLRPVQWVICHVEAGIATCILLSPFEVQELLPDIRECRKVTLHVYSPRVVASVRPLDDLSFCAVPELPPTQLPPLVITHLNLFAGQLYLRDYEEYISLCRFLGLCYRPPDNDVQVSCDGFITPRSRATYDPVMEESCPFSTSPIGLLKVLVDLRRQGQGFSRSHVGKIISGQILTKRDFEDSPSRTP